MPWIQTATQEAYQAAKQTIPQMGYQTQVYYQNSYQEVIQVEVPVMTQLKLIHKFK